MEDLIKALQVFLKYTNEKFPTHCEHDVMYVAHGVRPEDMSEEDVQMVEKLSFSFNESLESWCSYRFGSA